MNVNEMIDRLDRLIDASHVGILAVCDDDGSPTMRWMTPTLIRGRKGMIYALSSNQFEWPRNLEKHQSVQWIFQSQGLQEIMTVDGLVRVLDNPDIKGEVQEAIGRNLEVFWRVNPDADDFIVLETEMKRITLFEPMEDNKESVEVKDL
jgi:pyridoxamine 5'-phosphate oxidase